MLGYPGDSFEPLFTALKERIEAEGGRVLIDRPVASLEREGDRASPSWPGAPGSFRSGHDPARFPADGSPERYDARRRDGPERRLPRAGRRPRRATATARSSRRSSTTRRSACCSSSTGSSRRYYWTNVADRSVPFVGLVEHTNFIDATRYGGRRFLYVANYVEPQNELLGPRSGRAARRVRAEPAQGQPGLRPVLGQGPLALRRARRAADRHRRLPRDDPAAADRRAGPRAGQHDAGLSGRPRHELRRAPRRAGGPGIGLSRQKRALGLISSVAASCG